MCFILKDNNSKEKWHHYILINKRLISINNGLRKLIYIDSFVNFTQFLVLLNLYTCFSFINHLSWSHLCILRIFKSYLSDKLFKLMSYLSNGLGPSPFLTASFNHFHGNNFSASNHPHYSTNSYTNMPNYMSSYASP